MQLLRFYVFALFISLLPEGGWAGCQDDRRIVSFDREVVQFRSYNCDIGESKLRVEFHRLGTVPATTLLANEPSQRVRDAVGAPRIVQNDVSSTFKSLLHQYGRVVDENDTLINFEAEASGAGGVAKKITDVGEWRNARIIDSGGSYPPFDEGDSIQSKIIPNKMKFFYTNYCKDEVVTNNSDSSVCRNINASTLMMLFWRTMQEGDVNLFRHRLHAYNTANARDVGSMRAIEVPANLRLMRQIAGAKWPDEFVILYGSPTDEQGCDDGRFFAYVTPVIMLDVVLIENKSEFPVSIDGLIGGMAPQTSLRTASASSALAAGENVVGGPMGTLAVNERLLIPLRIYLGPNDAFETLFPYRKTATEIYQRIGANGYTGNTSAFGAPTSKAYVYGPEIAIGGILVNGSTLKLSKRAANFMEITMTSEAGSCPYLLSWNDRENEWIEHGKILDGAPSKSKSYTEVKAFRGFRGRFRIDEREPEMAFVERAALTVILADNRVVALEPIISAEDGRVQGAASIPWGHHISIEFKLPDEVPPKSVVKSFLAITGYYSRYSTARLIGSR